MGERGYETIKLLQEGRVARIFLSRPEVHNAFNSTMIRELDNAFEKFKSDESIRVVVLTGEGKSFCSGADINWMREIIGYSYGQNLEESLGLAKVLEKIYLLPKPTIARVNGTAIGGGNGFLSACDIAIASKKAKFGLSEVKIGLVPAAISPYVLRRIGESRAKEYFLTGERFDAQRAFEIGLVNKVVPHEKLDEEVAKIIESLLSSGPEAIAKCKVLVQNIAGMTLEEAKLFTARMIADLRVSEEGQEGMAAYLEKRKPKWTE